MRKVLHNCIDAKVFLGLFIQSPGKREYHKINVLFCAWRIHPNGFYEQPIQQPNSRQVIKFWRLFPQWRVCPFFLKPILTQKVYEKKPQLNRQVVLTQKSVGVWSLVLQTQLGKRGVAPIANVRLLVTKKNPLWKQDSGSYHVFWDVVRRLPKEYPSRPLADNHLSKNPQKSDSHMCVSNN